MNYMRSNEKGMTSLEDVAYIPSGAEEHLFSVAYQQRTPLLLLGPTGCGKTRLVEHIAEKFSRPLITVACHDDLTTADLVGRHLIRGGDVIWQDGPLTTAMRQGAICYLDEVVEARSDTLAVLHSVADHRRTLFLDRTGEELVAAPEFLLVASYSPRPAGSPKELKPSLRQRFATLRMDYLPDEAEAAVVAARTGLQHGIASRLIKVASALRDAANRDRHRRFDPPSTRTMVQAGALITGGARFEDAVESCMVTPLSSDQAVEAALRELVAASCLANQKEASIG